MSTGTSKNGPSDGFFGTWIAAYRAMLAAAPDEIPAKFRLRNPSLASLASGDPPTSIGVAYGWLPMDRLLDDEYKTAFKQWLDERGVADTYCAFMVIRRYSYTSLTRLSHDGAMYQVLSAHDSAADAVRALVADYGDEWAAQQDGLESVT